MNTQKLKEALVELRHQRALLDGAISNLEGILNTLESAAPEGAKTSAPRANESYIDLAVKLLEQAGEPIHIAEIARKISGIRGKTIPRASVESSIVRHIKIAGNKSRIMKVRPAFFGLPIWKGFTKDSEPLLSNLTRLTRVS